MSAMKYKGCVFAMLEDSPREVSASTVELFADALRDAMENAPTRSLKDVARYLVTTTFKDVSDTQHRYNAFRSAMVHLNIDVKGSFWRFARMAWAMHKKHDSEYWKGVAHGLSASAVVVASPMTLGNDLKIALFKGQAELQEELKAHAKRG